MQLWSTGWASRAQLLGQAVAARTQGQGIGASSRRCSKVQLEHGSASGATLLAHLSLSLSLSFSLSHSLSLSLIFSLSLPPLTSKSLPSKPSMCINMHVSQKQTKYATLARLGTHVYMHGRTHACTYSCSCATGTDKLLPKQAVTNTSLPANVGLPIQVLGCRGAEAGVQGAPDQNR